MDINELKQLQIICIAQLQQKNVSGICSKGYPSTLDKQRICVNMQLKSSKKQLK